MRKYIVFCVVLVLALMAGCSKKESVEKTYHHTFKGESEHWTATYEVKGNGGLFERQKGTKVTSTRELTVTYKGDAKELSTLKELEYGYLSSESKGHKTVTFDQPVTKKSFTLKNPQDVEMESADETVSVIIKWGGKEEKVDVKTEQKETETH